ncbi:MAG: hypothetical protein VX610_05320 [SAR324 cluster bacterium]|nr:hypothetical protein [SAR324 cluster bacterium]
MPKLDALKESIAFLTKVFFVLVGTILLTVGGLVTMYLNQQTGRVFWLGVVVILILVFSSVVVLSHIRKNIKNLEEL